MKKFTRQKSSNASNAEVTLDFGAAAAKVARVFEPDDYKLRIDPPALFRVTRTFLLL